MAEALPIVCRPIGCSRSRSSCDGTGATVRRHREGQEISQEKLAELAELHRTYVSSLERGHRNVSVVNIVRLARALKVEPATLLAGLS